MEADDDCRRDEDAGRIERARARDVARVERQLNAGNLAAIFVGAAARLIVKTLENIRQIISWLFVCCRRQPNGATAAARSFALLTFT